MKQVYKLTGWQEIGVFPRFQYGDWISVFPRKWKITVKGTMFNISMAEVTTCFRILLLQVLQDIIHYTVLAWGLDDLPTIASWISIRLVHLQEQRHMLTVRQWTSQTVLVPMNSLPPETQPCDYHLGILFEWNSKCPLHVSWGGGWWSQTLHHLLCHLP